MSLTQQSDSEGVSTRMHTHVQAGAVGVGVGVRHTRAHIRAGRGRGGRRGRGRHGHAASLDSVMCGSSCGTLNKNCYPFRILKQPAWKCWEGT